VYLAGVLRLPAESCFTLEIFDTLSLLRVLPFSTSNQINANPRKYRRVGPIFFEFLQKSFFIFDDFFVESHQLTCFFQESTLSPKKAKAITFQ
jgi:hypothetical protein